MTNWRHRLFLILGVLALWTALPVLRPAAAQSYLVGVPCITPQCRYPEFERLIEELYDRVGIEIQFERLPMLRDLRSLNIGYTDASITRAAIDTYFYPNLVPVPVPLGVFEIAIFTPQDGPRPQSPKDLGGMSVGILRGDSAATHISKTTGLDATMYNDTETVVLMLDRGRIDAALLPVYTAKTWSAKLGVGPLQVSPPLYREFFYHMVNKKHADLVPELSTALQRMYQDGTAERILGKLFMRNLGCPME